MTDHDVAEPGWAAAALLVLALALGCSGDDGGLDGPVGAIPPFCTAAEAELACEAEIDGEPGPEQFVCQQGPVLRCVGDVDDRPGDEAFTCLTQGDGTTLCNLADAVPVRAE